MKYLQPQWPAPKNVKAYTTTRIGWGGRINVSSDVPAYLPLSHELDALKTLLPIPSEPIWLNQVHKSLAVPAVPENIGQEADASYTRETNRVCAVATADCLPIFICDQQGTCVAALHAGWRGLAAGIIEASVAALNKHPNELLVWLGPAIGPDKFEVGKDVYDVFVSKHPETIVAFNLYKVGKWLANLYLLAKIRLKIIGIEKVYGGGYCTFSQDDLFFSYRRDKGKTGRMLSLIWIDDQ